MSKSYKGHAALGDIPSGDWGTGCFRPLPITSKTHVFQGDCRQESEGWRICRMSLRANLRPCLYYICLRLTSESLDILPQCNHKCGGEIEIYSWVFRECRVSPHPWSRSLTQTFPSSSDFCNSSPTLGTLCVNYTCTEGFREKALAQTRPLTLHVASLKRGSTKWLSAGLGLPPISPTCPWHTLEHASRFLWGSFLSSTK